MYQQLWGYKVEEKLYLGVREQKRLNTTALDDASIQFTKWYVLFVILDHGQSLYIQLQQLIGKRLTIRLRRR
jgi:hypothetical protein